MFAFPKATQKNLQQIMHFKVFILFLYGNVCEKLQLRDEGKTFFVFSYELQTGHLSFLHSYLSKLLILIKYGKA